MIKAPIALGVYLSGVMTNSSMSSSRKSSITTPPTANNPGMLIVVWDHRNDIKCSHSLSEVPRRGPWRTPEEQVHPIVPSSYSVKVYRLPVVSAGTCTCLIIFREPIISQSPLHLVDNCQSDRRAPGVLRGSSRTGQRLSDGRSFCDVATGREHRGPSYGPLSLPGRTRSEIRRN